MKMKVWKKYLVVFIATTLMSISTVAPCAAIPSESLKDSFTTNKGTYSEVSWNDPENGRVYYSDWNANTGQWKKLYFGDGSFLARLYFTCTADSTDVNTMQTKLESHFGEGYEIKVVSEDDIIRCWVTDHNMLPDTAEKVDALYSTFNENDLRIFKYSPQIGELYECIGTGMIGCYIGTEEQIEAIANWVAENAPDWEFQISSESSGELRLKGKDVTEVDPAQYLKIQYDIRKAIDIAPQNYNIPETRMFDFSEEKVYFDVSGVDQDLLFRQVNSITQTQKTIYEAQKPADGDVVAYYNSDHFRGVVCRCADPAQYETEENSPLHLMELADCLDTYSIGDDELHLTMEDVKIPDALSGETLFVLSAAQDDMKQFLLDHPDAEPVGILVSHIRQRSYYNTMTFFWLEPAEGKTIDAAALEKEYGIYYVAGDWCAATNSLEEAAALCEKLEAREDIKFAWLSGTRLRMLQGSDFAGMEILPLIDSYLAGDADGNGSVDLGDALTALQAYSDTELMKQPNPLTAAQFIAADMDGDGKVTIEDALTILQTYTDETLLHQ